MTSVCSQGEDAAAGQHNVVSRPLSPLHVAGRESRSLGKDAASERLLLQEMSP